MGEPECGLCHHGTNANKVCGRLYTSQKVTAHLKCMQYSAGLIQYENRQGFGGFKMDKVQREISRGRKLKCHICKSTSGGKSPKSKVTTGATSGCAIQRCSKTFHYYCAHKSKAAVTRRLEVMVPEKEGRSRKVVEYRVFCSEKHLNSYEDGKRKEKHYIRKKREESGSEGSQYSDSDADVTHVDPADIETDSSSEEDIESESTSNTANRDVKNLSSSDTDEFESLRKPCIPSSSQKRDRTPPHAKKRKSSASTKRSDEESDDDDLSGYNGQVSKRQKNVDVGDQEVTPVTIGTLTPLSKEKGKTNQKSVAEVIEEASRALKKSVDLSKQTGATIAKLNPEEDMLLCFVEAAEINEKLEHKLRKFATKMYHIPSQSLHVSNFPGRTITPEHVAYFLKDLSHTLCVGDLEEFQSLVLRLQEEDINKYNYIIQANTEYPEELTQTVYSKLRQSIRENLQTASVKLGKAAGWYCKVEHMQEQLRVGLLALSDHTDPSGVIRQFLRKTPDIYQWSSGGELNNSPMDTSSNENRQEEFKILRNWLSTSRKFTVQHFPQDKYIQGDLNHSMTVQLTAHFQSDPSAKRCEHSLVLLHPLNTKVVRPEVYLKKFLLDLFSESSASYTSTILVFDVNDDIDIEKDILALVPENIKYKIFSAFNPEIRSISCVLVQFEVEESSNQLQPSEGEPSSRVSEQLDDEGACEVTAVEIPRGDVYFLPPDLKWRLLQCNSLGLTMQSVTASTLVQTKTPVHLGRPSLTQKIKGDGNCFFRAMSLQITGSQNQHYELRKCLVKYMVDNKEVFSKFFNLKNVKLYLDMKRMGDDSTWATDTEIIAMASLLDTQIVIYTAVAKFYKWLPYSPIGKPASNKCKVYLVNKKYHFDLVLSVAEKKKPNPKAPSESASTKDSGGSAN